MNLPDRRSHGGLGDHEEHDRDHVDNRMWKNFSTSYASIASIVRHRLLARDATQPCETASVDAALPVGDPVSGTDARRPERRPLEGRFVTLRPVDPEADADPLWRAAHDGTDEAARLWTYLSYGPFADAVEMGRWLEECSPSEDPLFLTVLSQASGPVGIVSFLNVETAHRRLELGHIWYAPVAQRTEANTESVSLMLGEAFERLGHRRVEWKCDALNERSRAAALRLGFTFEGVFRNHMIVKGRNRDSAWFSMTAEEWPAASSAFDRWLTTEPASRPSLASLR
jgi:RimJ/RimL family protein N-acetyltransferase